MADTVKRSKTKYKNIYFNENTKKYDVKFNFKEYDPKIEISILLQKPRRNWQNCSLVALLKIAKILPLKASMSYGLLKPRAKISAQSLLRTLNAIWL